MVAPPEFGSQQSFDLCELAAERRRSLRPVRYGVLALLVWFVFIASLAAANRSLLVQVVLFAALGFVAALTIWVFKFEPVRVTVDERGVLLGYPRGGGRWLLWTDPKSVIYLHDLRNRTQFTDKPLPVVVWAARRTGGLVAPLSIEAYEAWVAAGRQWAASVVPVAPSRWEYVGGFVIPGETRLQIRGGRARGNARLS